ncbi:MAG: hypothetical protein WEB60_02795 [Terrimicrobiaceae bacterium]
MRFFFILLPTFIFVVSSLYGVDSTDFGICYSIPDGFTVQQRNPPLKGWPEIYLVQSSKEHPDAKYPLDLSISSFNDKFTAMMLGAGDQMKGTYKKQIGSHAVVVLPGFPGPYGEDAFFYIVPRGDNTSIGIIAPRILSKRGVSLKDRPPSGMDSIVEGLIATLRFTRNAENK